MDRRIGPIAASAGEGSGHESDGVAGAEHAVRAGAAARSGRGAGRGGGPRHHLRRRADHPARQGRPPEGAVPAHHRPRDHRRDRRDRPRRARHQGRRRGDDLLLSQLRPLPLVPAQPRAAVREHRRPGRARMRRRLRRIRQAAGAELHQAAGRPRPQEAPGRDRRRHRRAGDALQGAAPRPRRRPARRRRGDRRRRRARHPSGDDGEMGQHAGDRGRHQGRTSSRPAARPAPTRWWTRAKAASPSS